MNKKKILKLLLIVVLIVIAIFLIHTIRNYIIISKLQNMMQSKLEVTNVYRKIQNTHDNGTRNYSRII